MSFVSSSSSLKSKAHLGSLHPGVLVIAAALLVAVAAGGFFAASAFCSSDGFGIEAAEPSAADAGETQETTEGKARDGSGEAVASAEGDGRSSVEPSAAVGAGSKSIYVHVIGAVKRPGVYALPEQSRVVDAVESAGGLSENAASDSLNLAQQVTDGQQISVLTKKQAKKSQIDLALSTSASGSQGSQAGSASQAEAASTSASGSASSSAKVNINQATADQLDELPGVGPATAQKIIADRDQNGPFASCEDLQRVSGIGEKKYAELASLITI